MSTEVTTVLEFGAELEQLRVRHAERNKRPLLSAGEITERARLSSAETITAYLAGTALPGPAILDRLTVLFGASPGERRRLNEIRDRLAAEADPGGEPVRRNWLTTKTVLGLTAAAVVIAIATTALFHLPAAEPQGGKLGAAHDGPAADCVPLEVWTHSFDPGFEGDVYVLMADFGSVTRTASVDLVRAGRHWRRTVDVHPGVPAQGTGGTMLAFANDPGAPDVTLRSDPALCAAFGTSATEPAAVPALYLRVDGWS
ncbi:hypothetical protein GCM10010435_67690 [Winogradskya consettensis]|uniref:Helix-turn-helix domain-containing protein n=1 Tax=Winogradskya consettensis TaxID=113560 RepID=A0A919VPF3_9ACTN|nr:helix-turn-helix transcriptional regulator [Actinoplanes consettensis]GIM73779.1 hypothetical protein Aco04nite_37080 [Actinoplanes consettensis]